MKGFIMMSLFCARVLLGQDEAKEHEIRAKSGTIEELSYKMQEAPKEYRYYYIEAIKRLVIEENELKQKEVMETLGGRGRGRGGGNGGGRGGR